MFEVVQEQYFPAIGATRGYSDGGRVVATFEIEKSADDFIKELRSKLSGEFYVSKREVKEVKEEKVSNKITAAEARKLAGPTVQERVDEVYPLIREAAEKGKRWINLHDWWADEGYRGSVEYKQACMILEGDGYTVKFFYEERQFVAMYTTVEW
jgi:hypothetical protein